MFKERMSLRLGECAVVGGQKTELSSLVCKEGMAGCFYICHNDVTDLLRQRWALHRNALPSN
jgi:hypothetical protein